VLEALQSYLPIYAVGRRNIIEDPHPGTVAPHKTQVGKAEISSSIGNSRCEEND